MADANLLSCLEDQCLQVAIDVVLAAESRENVYFEGVREAAMIDGEELVMKGDFGEMPVHEEILAPLAHLIICLKYIRPHKQPTPSVRYPLGLQQTNLLLQLVRKTHYFHQRLLQVLLKRALKLLSLLQRGSLELNVLLLK